jgi:hypothetical protein
MGARRGFSGFHAPVWDDPEDPPFIVKRKTIRGRSYKATSLIPQCQAIWIVRTPFGLR